MGYMLHHAILITSWDDEKLAKAREAVVLLGAQYGMEGLVSPVCEAHMNRYASFAIFPDGSKEGWEASDEGDSFRGAVVAYLDTERYEDGSSNLHWVEVAYAGDEPDETRIVRHGGTLDAS